jgi:hypothetical protein
MARSPRTPILAAAFNQGKFPTIAFVNQANTPLGVDLDKLVPALQKQMDQDFVPIWGYPAKLYVTDKPKADEWQVVFFDDADAANALGYHDLTKDGQPISKVFVRTTIAAQQKVSVTASHELLEMMIDPGAQLWAQNKADGLFYAYEMCDAVENEEYLIDDISVSDFVHPSFFESWHLPGSVQFDHLKRVSRPFETLQHGYQIVSDGQSSREVFGSAAKELNFRTLEIRTQHRSEYRKLLQGVPPHPGGTAPMQFGSPQAAVLYHAGQFLTALAAATAPSQPGMLPGRQVNPFPWPWQTDPPRGSQVNPFPYPWQTDPPAGPLGRQVNPFPWPWQTDPPRWR